MTAARYFLEVSYKGSNYSGFQKQKNANSIQSEVEKAFFILLKEEIELTGSSRTDAGVHAMQNFFHFDYAGAVDLQLVYRMNAILPPDIVIIKLTRVSENMHCRFDATSRSYKYFIYHKKNPFLQDRAYYYPYSLDLESMMQAARILTEYQDFTTFSKRNTQVKSFLCTIRESNWILKDDVLVYYVKANRFLRGMVRGLTGTMLQVGRGIISLEEMRTIITDKDCSKANFAVPSHGLFLVKIEYPETFIV